MLCQLVYEDVAGDHDKSLAKVEINDIRCSPLATKLVSSLKKADRVGKRDVPFVNPR